jgi:hypothetical protein
MKQISEKEEKLFRSALNSVQKAAEERGGGGRRVGNFRRISKKKIIPRKTE